MRSTSSRETVTGPRGVSNCTSSSRVLPVVPSNMTGASELIEGESQEFILKEKTPAEYAQKLKALLENSELRKSVGKLNYETAIKHTDEARANDFEDLLRSRGLFFKD